MNEYDKQADKFLKDTKTKLTIRYLKHDKHFEDEENTRDIYNITIKNPKGEYTFKFGNSISDTLENKEPKPYNVLACLTTYDPEDFKNFCDSYGYEEDSRKAERTYKAVVEELENLKRLFTIEELEQLGEIC